jgi:hypothetical protein
VTVSVAVYDLFAEFADDLLARQLRRLHCRPRHQSPRPENVTYPDISKNVFF